MLHPFRRLAFTFALVAVPGLALVATRADSGGGAAAPAGQYAIEGTWTANSDTHGPVHGSYTGEITVLTGRRATGCFETSGTLTYLARDASGRWLGRIVAPLDPADGGFCVHGRPGVRTHSFRSDVSGRSYVSGRTGAGETRLRLVEAKGRFVDGR